jgi:type I restriction enzyme S subunit
MSVERHLPEGWRWVTFVEVAREVSKSTRTPLEDGFERYVGLEHFDSDSLALKRWGLIADDNPTFTKVFRAGQLLFGRRRAYQRKAAIADFDGICSGDIIVMEAKPEQLIPDLLPFIVQSEGFWDYAIHTSAGSLSPRTKWANLAAYKFPLPPLDEQRRIAEILWALEEAIEDWTQAVLLTAELKQALIAQFIPSSTHALSDVEKGTFSTLAAIDHSIQLAFSDTDVVSFIAMADVSDEGGIINIQSRTYGEVKQGYTTFAEGDILFAKITPCLENGKGAIAQGLIQGVGFGSTEFFVLTPKIESDREFIYHLCQNPIVRRRAESFMQGSAGQKRLPRNFFFRFPILFPQPIERKALGARLTDLDRIVTDQRSHIARLKQIKSVHLQNIWGTSNVQ